MVVTTLYRSVSTASTTDKHEESLDGHEARKKSR